MLFLYFLVIFAKAESNVHDGQTSHKQNLISRTISAAASKELKHLQSLYPGYGTEWIPMDMDDNGQLIIGHLTMPSHGKSFFAPEPSEAVSFTLYTREHSDGMKINNSISEVKNIFDKNKPTKFVTHGWMSSGSQDTCISIMEGFLQKYDCNVFIMDWKAIADNPVYPIPMSETRRIGDYYAEFLNDLIDGFDVDPKSIHLVGHSLGAHVSGFAARGVKKGKIHRVTGLDPALPGFNLIQVVEGGRLNKDDAEFVDIIHTCAGVLGIPDPIGHCDAYPNGGTMPQPGCNNILQMMAACSHGRSWKLFATSLVSNVPLLAHKCQSFETLSNEHCNTDPIPIGDPTPFTARGVYYLQTSDEKPYALGTADSSNSTSEN